MFHPEPKSILFTEPTFGGHYNTSIIDQAEKKRRARKLVDRRRKKCIPKEAQDTEIRKLLRTRVSILKDRLTYNNPGGQVGGIMMGLAMYYCHVLQGDKIANLPTQKRVALLEELRGTDRRARKFKVGGLRTGKVSVREMDALQAAIGKLGIGGGASVKGKAGSDWDWEDEDEHTDMEDIGLSLAEIEISCRYPCGLCDAIEANYLMHRAIPLAIRPTKCYFEAAQTW